MDISEEEDVVDGFCIEEKLSNVRYCIRSRPNWGITMGLAFQHYLLKLGTTMMISEALVAMIGGGEWEKARVLHTLMFITGINTLLQTFFGTRLPVVIGASWTYLAPLITMVVSHSYSRISDPHQRFIAIMRATQGAHIIASIFQLVIGFSGIWRVLLWLINPLTATSLIVGLGLGFYRTTFPQLGNCLEIGLPTCILLLLISQYVPRLLKTRKTIFEEFGMIFTLMIIWLYTVILNESGAYHKRPIITQHSCRAGRSDIVNASSWFKFSLPFQWGTPTFGLEESLTMTAVCFVSLVESTGTYLCSTRYGGATHIPPSILSRGIGWQGFGMLLSGLFGTGVGCGVSNENVGLIASTRIGSRCVIQISAVLMILFSLFEKVQACFASIPAPAIASLCFIFHGYQASSGIGLVQFCNINNFRMKLVLGVSIFTGLSIPNYIRNRQSQTSHTFLPSFLETVLLSEATVAVLVAVLLDSTLDRRSRRAEKESGRIWWNKFMTYKGNVQSQEYYSLPLDLDNYFPPV